MPFGTQFPCPDSDAKRKNDATAKLIVVLVNHGEALVEKLEHSRAILEVCASDRTDPGAAYAALQIEQLLAALERDAGEGL